MEALLFEPDRQTRSTLHLVLAQLGYGVTICHDEEAAWNRARDSSFDLTIVGLQSDNPGLVDRVVATARQHSTTALIVVPRNGNGQGELPVLGETPHLIDKPVDVSMLRQCLKWIKERRSGRRSGDEDDGGMRRRGLSESGGVRRYWPVEAPSPQNEAWFRAFIQYATDLFAVVDPAGTLLYVSPSMETLTGYEADQLIDSNGFELIHPEDQDTAWRTFTEALSMPGMTIAPIEARLYRSDGGWRWYEIRGTNLLDITDVGGVVIHARDVHDRRVADEALRQSEERFRALVQNASDMVAIVSQDGAVTYQSPSVERVLGLTFERVTDADLERFIHPDDRDRVRKMIGEIVKTPGTATRLEFRLHHPDGSLRTIDAVCTNLTHNPSIGGLIVNARDTTDRKSLEQQLTRLAFFDALTGLPNRPLLQHRLEELLEQVAADEKRIAVLFMDLDRFKVVNDSLGHEAGDRLLATIGERLRQLVRPGDTIARLGGDEFVVLLDDVERQQEAVVVAERIIRGLESPLTVDDHEVSVSASVGICLSEVSGNDARDLMRNADIALYRAKATGPGQYTVFHDGMAEQAVERLDLENRLRRAIDQDEFRLRYLPEVDLSSGRLVGLEVLLRWQDPARGLIRPGAFMEVAEETGLIVPIGRWAFDQACQRIRRWHDLYADARDLVISVNLSSREFRQPDLVNFIRTTLDRYGIAPDRIRLEIAETIMVSNSQLALQKLQQLRDYGLQLAIDDFGTGYSSLSYLTQTSFDVLKLDPQFVSGPGGVESNLSIVKAVTSLAHALDMTVSAAGIESRDQLRRIRDVGCDYGQGVLFSEPLAGDAVEEQLFVDDPEE